MIEATALRPAGSRRRRGARPAQRREGRRRRRDDDGDQRAESEHRRVDEEPGLRLGTTDRSERKGRARRSRQADTGDGTDDDRREHRGRVRRASAAERAEADGFEHDRVARTALEVPRDCLGHHDHAGRGSDGGEQEQRIALQRRRPLDRLDVDLLVGGVAEGADPGRQVGGERVPVDTVGHVQRQDRARLVGRSQRPPASVGPARMTSWPSGSSTRSSLSRTMPTTLGVSDAHRLALQVTAARTAGHGRRRRCPHAVPRAR